MIDHLRAVVGATFLVCLGFLAAPAVLAGDPCFHGYSIPPSTTAAGSVVEMEPCAFLPTNLEVDPGATVTFSNVSADVHLLTGANQEWGDREREIAPGASVSVTFDRPGVYAFSCALHRGMSGSVIVGGADQAAGAAPAAETAAGAQAGWLPALAISGLAAIAIVGWAVALLQRRRGDAVRREQAPAN